MSSNPPLPPDGASSSPERPRLPWEERSRLGLIESLVQTIRLLVTNPADAFSRLRPDGDLTSPMLFGIIVSWVCILFSQAWNMMFAGTFRSVDGFEQLFRTPSLFEFLGGMLLWPVMFVVMAFLGSAILHLCLLMVGATSQSEHGFEGTLKVYVYAIVAWFAFLVPIAGSIVAMLWQLVLFVIGFAKIHRTSEGRALTAVLIPTILCCVCILGIVGIVGAQMLEYFQNFQ